ncbi:MAG: glycosyltransferase [Chitinophagales bacterium]|nr:glycosyltransferase [Chitinophagales bacterium]
MRLFYFTTSYPFGYQEQWKTNELRVLVNYFDEITVVPYCYGITTEATKDLPKGVKVLGPLFETENNFFPVRSRQDIFKLIRSKHFFTFAAEYLKKKVYKDHNKYKKWLRSSLEMLRLTDNKILRSVFDDAREDDVFYFYWGLGTCEVIPFLGNGNKLKTFVRMHRFDLFEDVNDFYIPYRTNMMKALKVVAPSSLTGKIELDKYYPAYKDKVSVFRCGTVSDGRMSKASDDGVLRIVSCSLLSDVKRVHIMIQALKMLDIPVQWSHLGDGLLKEELKELVNSLGLQDKFIFLGQVNSSQVLSYYKENTIDLFINVSKSEGVPFSIMEAFSVGIPVIATDAGGTKEIVDDEVGELLPNEVTPEILAASINRFYLHEGQIKNKKRTTAYARYREMCDAEKLANELGEYLVHKL